MNLYKGIVVAIDDSRTSGIIKCRVDGLYNTNNLGSISDEHLPNVYPLYSQASSMFYSPKIGDEVYIILDRNDKYVPFWIGTSKLSDDLLSKLSDDYEGFKSIVSDGEEKLDIWYSRSDGMTIKLDKTSINIKDNEVIIDNGNRVLHLRDNMVSIGSNGTSAEPATLGDKNVDALNAITTELTKLTTAITVFCTTQSAVTKAIPFLAPLTAGYDVLLPAVQSIQTTINGVIKAVDIPATKSKKTSLD